ncbi:MAG TPA: hypothetical protein VNO18_05015 [Xanthobacteraceae bacterium]|nr:hypothetical protein [Xanthobacteraceae bacterium]
MRDLLLLAIHLLVTLAKFLGPGGVRRVAAESLLLKHQLLISNRSRQRAPNLTTLDRLVLGLTTLFVSPHRIPKLSASLKPATLFKFHKAFCVTSAVCLTVRNCMRDGGRPFEVGNQVLISSHRKLLTSKAMVVSVAETPGQDSGRQG